MRRSCHQPSTTLSAAAFTWLHFLSDSGESCISVCPRHLFRDSQLLFFSLLDICFPHVPLQLKKKKLPPFPTSTYPQPPAPEQHRARASVAIARNTLDPTQTSRTTTISRLSTVTWAQPCRAFVTSTRPARDPRPSRP